MNKQTDNADEYDQKLLQLLESNDPEHRALGGQLCKGLEGNYGSEVKARLQWMGPWFCLTHDLEPDFLKKIRDLFPTWGLSKLTSLPPSLGRLKKLLTLQLNDHSLTQLPPEVGSLSYLRILFLSNNKLISLPPEIGKLNRLWKLDLSWNHLKDLPEEVGNMSNLQVLNLSGNQFTHITKAIGRLNHLTRLLLNYNELKSLPVEIGQLSNLKVLDLSNNCFPTGYQKEIQDSLPHCRIYI